jgi:hypothetical protein
MLLPVAAFVCYQIRILYGLKNCERGFDIRAGSYQHTI